jgi:hypothetical protein
MESVVVVQGAENVLRPPEPRLNVTDLVAENLAAVDASAGLHAPPEDVLIGKGHPVPKDFSFAPHVRKSVQEAHESGGAGSASTEQDEPLRRHAGGEARGEVGSSGLEMMVLLSKKEIRLQYCRMSFDEGLNTL